MQNPLEQKQIHPDGTAERWRDVVGYEGIYQVSCRGRVRSVPRIIHAHCSGEAPREIVLTIRGRIRRLVPMVSGHLSVSLFKNGKGVNRLVHHLVLESFIGPCPDGMECRHFPDRNPANNKLENLQWGTRSENQKDRSVHGTKNKGALGIKLTMSMARKIRRTHMKEGLSLCRLAKAFGIAYTTAWQIINNKTWKEGPDAARKRLRRLGKNLIDYSQTVDAAGKIRRR